MGVVKIIGENFAMKDSWRCWQADHGGERLPMVIFGQWVSEDSNCLYTAKKSIAIIPTSRPDDAGPNGQADGKCVQQTYRTFPLCYVIHVGKILQCSISR
jgi:hypothetical protein